MSQVKALYQGEQRVATFFPPMSVRRHAWLALSQLVTRKGDRWRGRGVAWPTSSRLRCTLLACWEEGHEEPWLLVTDLGPRDATAVW